MESAPNEIDTFADIAGEELGEPVNADELAEVVQLLTGQVTSTSFLTPTQESDLAKELDEMLEAYDGMMKERWDRERLIDECYHLVPQKQWQGAYEDPAELVSETIMAGVDQAHARVVGQYLSVKPFALFEGVESILPDEDSTVLAKMLETWEDRYLRHKLRLKRKVPEIVYSTTKFGTAVVRAWWDQEAERVRWDLVQNRDAVLWPAWSRDWQEAEWVGHRTVMTVSQFRRFCQHLGVDPAKRQTIEQKGESKPEGAVETFAVLKTEGIDSETVTSIRDYNLIEIYGLRGHLTLPEEEYPSKFQVFFHRESKTILAAHKADQRSGRHDYHPIRYKVPDNSGWGQGVGQELMQVQAADTMFMNLEADTLRSACFGVYVVGTSTGADLMFDRPSPGQKIATDSPKEDFRYESLADAAPLQMLNLAKGNYDQRRIRASGLASVLEGQGDPTMKSGAGTGGVMALIAEAGKKFGQIDLNIREDFNDLCLHTLELAVQYGQGKPFVEYLPPEEAQGLVQALLALPQERPLSEVFSISVAAPSANNNEEIRKQALMVLYNMVQQHAQAMIQGYAAQIYPATNPAGMIPYLLEWSDLIAQLGERVIESHEVPGFKGKVPKIEIQPSPAQAQLNVLIAQLGEMRQVIQALTGGGPGGEGNNAAAGAGANSDRKPSAPSGPPV